MPGGSQLMFVYPFRWHTRTYSTSIFEGNSIVNKSIVKGHKHTKHPWARNPTRKKPQNQERLTYPVASAFGPGSVIDISIYPLVKQNLFHLCSIPLRYGGQWFATSSRSILSFPTLVVIRPGLYHSWSFVAPYHRSTLIRIEGAPVEAGAGLVWVVLMSMILGFCNLKKVSVNARNKIKDGLTIQELHWRGYCPL
jgi:hypothetical protein